jgi:glycosyltransferase involved in cell wall biosynthesis
MPSLAVVHSNIAPYFQARIQAASALGEVISIPLRSPTIDADLTLPIFGADEDVTLLADQIPSRVFGILDRVRPNVVVLQSWVRKSALAGLVWATRNRVPVVMMGDFQVHSRRAWNPSNMVKKRLLQCCSAFVLAGNPHRDFLVRLGISAEKIWIGFDVVDNQHFADGAAMARANDPAIRQRLGLPERYFLAVSRLDANKNVGALLRAFAAYSIAIGTNSWHLVVVGNGPLMDQLRSDSDRLGVSERVHFLGQLDYAKMPALYGLASAFVHPSCGDTWGLVVNEAMAAGLPVFISYATSCQHDLVHSDNGATFHPHNPAELTSHLMRATDGTYDLISMGLRSSERIRAWSLDVFAVNLWAAAKEAMGAGPKAVSSADHALLTWLSRFPPGGP